MGSRQSKTVVTNEAQTPETNTFRQIIYSVSDKGYKEKFKDTQREFSRTVKTQNIEQHTNE